MLSYLIESTIFGLKFMGVAIPLVFVIILLLEKYKTDDNYMEMLLSFIEFMMLIIVAMPVLLLISICEFIKENLKESKKVLNIKKEVLGGK